MKKFLAALLIAGSFFLMPAVNAEIKTYEGTDEYIMNEFETIDIAKQRAKQKAERNAQEQAGVYISSYSEMKNLELVTDEVISIACGILSVIDVKYNVTPLENANGFLIRAMVKAHIETDDVNKWLNRAPEERSDLVDKNLELQKAIAAQDEQIAELKSKLASAESRQEQEKISAQFAAEDKVFLSNQKMEDAMKTYCAGDMKSTLSLCTQAIELNSDNALAYSMRGVIFYLMKDYNGAISDLNRAIELNPSEYKNFYNRGLANVKLNNYRAAANDFEAALQLNPNDDDSRYNRDLCYRAMRY